MNWIDRRCADRCGHDDNEKDGVQTGADSGYWCIFPHTSPSFDLERETVWQTEKQQRMLVSLFTLEREMVWQTEK